MIMCDASTHKHTSRMKTHKIVGKKQQATAANATISVVVLCVMMNVFTE